METLLPYGLFALSSVHTAFLLYFFYLANSWSAYRNRILHLESEICKMVPLVSAMIKSVDEVTILQVDNERLRSDNSKLLESKLELEESLKILSDAIK